MVNIIYEKLVGFAEKYSQIVGITKGVNPEGGFETYYFLAPFSSYSNREKLDDAVIELDLDLYNVYDVNCNVLVIPIGIEDVVNEDFLGDVIWKRDVT